MPGISTTVRDADFVRSIERGLAVIAALGHPGRGLTVAEVAYQAHMDSEHFTRLVKQEAIPELLESRERAFYVTLG